MRSRSAPFPVLFFASAAHGMHHVLLTLFLTLVLVIAPQWHLPYNDLVALWTLGAMLVGLGAPFAGWLADRIGETKVLVLCFLGLGMSAVLCGLAQNTMQLEAALALLGLSGSIYHPVGFAWVVKHARQRGRAIAIAGVAGSIGVAAGPVIAGGLATLAGWRTAFIVPGVVTLSIGALLLAIHLMGRIVERSNVRSSDSTGEEEQGHSWHRWDDGGRAADVPTRLTRPCAFNAWLVRSHRGRGHSGRSSPDHAQMK